MSSGPPRAIKLATILAAVGSSAFATWAATVLDVRGEAAVRAAVGVSGPALTMAGHFAFLLFGGLIGFALGIFVATTESLFEYCGNRLPYWTAVASPLAALTCLWHVSWIFYAPPRGLMEWLFR
jgi:hypothetical protein